MTPNQTREGLRDLLVALRDTRDDEDLVYEVECMLELPNDQLTELLRIDRTYAAIYRDLSFGCCPRHANGKNLDRGCGRAI